MRFLIALIVICVVPMLVQACDPCPVSTGTGIIQQSESIQFQRTGFGGRVAIIHSQPSNFLFVPNVFPSATIVNSSPSVVISERRGIFGRRSRVTVIR